MPAPPVVAALVEWLLFDVEDGRRPRELLNGFIIIILVVLMLLFVLLTLSALLRIDPSLRSIPVMLLLLLRELVREVPLPLRIKKLKRC